MVKESQDDRCVVARLIALITPPPPPPRSLLSTFVNEISLKISVNIKEMSCETLEFTIAIFKFEESHH